MTAPVILGHVAAVRRYPVKSMAGEELVACDVTERGLLGDRAYALMDQATGIVASAKNPSIWPNLLQYHAAFIDSPIFGAALPGVRITFPDGSAVASDGDPSEALSAALGRKVVLATRAPAQPMLQQFWPDLDATGASEPVTSEPMPPNTFFDLAMVNVLFTSTAERLAAACPDGKFDIRRFRPNIIVVPDSAGPPDPEAAWVGHTLAIGGTLRLKIDSRCTRCVMTTLPVADLPRDIAILRTVVRTNGGFAGLNMSVLQAGRVRAGDTVCVEP